MSKEKAIQQLEETINKTLPAIMSQFSFSNEYMEEKTITQLIFTVAQSNKPYSDELETAQDEKAIKVLTHYKETMKQAIDHIEQIRQHNKRFMSSNPTAEILTYVKKDDAVLLERLLKRNEKASDILSHYNYALRIAACGADRCMAYLLKTRCANITAPGPKSGKIALHYAISGGHLNCISALLKATDPLDYFNPTGQLLYGVYPNRPIDSLGSIKDKVLAAKIEQIIHTVLDSKEGQGIKTSAEQITEIKQILEEQNSQRQAESLTMR